MIESDWWQHFFSGVFVDLWLKATTEEQTRGEADFIEKVLQLSPKARVLDVPCGGGRHSLELASRGHRLTGVDLSEDFLKAARTRSEALKLPVAWTEGRMDELPWKGEFDGAFCFGNSFGYLDDAGNARFLRAVARSLKPGARFVLDTGVTAESLLPAFQERRWMPVGDILFLSQGRYDPVRGRLDTDYTFIRDGKSDTRSATTRVHTYRELRGLFEAAGFRDLEGFGSLSREAFQLGSPRLLLIGTKA